MKDSAMTHFQAIMHCMTKQAKPAGTVVDNLCDASLLRWTRANCKGIEGDDVGTIGQRYLG